MRFVLPYICIFFLITDLQSVYAQDQAVPSVPTSESTDSTAKSPLSEKEAAFKQYYKRDPACDSFKDDNMMDRCRNTYMTAKKEFEKIWAERNKQK